MRRCVALLAALTVATPAVAWAQDPGGAVAVDTSGLEAAGEALKPKVQAELDALLEEEGLDASSVQVRIEWLDAADFHYAIHASFDPDLPEDQLPIVETCRGCTTDAVVEKVVAGVRKLVDAEKRRLAQQEPPPPEVVAPVTAPPPPREDRPARRPLQATGWAGFGLLVAGAAVLGTGGAFVGVGETRPSHDMSQVRNFRPSGYGLLGTGAAFAIVGAILLTVDRVRAKRSGRAARRGPSSAWFRCNAGHRWPTGERGRAD